MKLLTLHTLALLALAGSASAAVYSQNFDGFADGTTGINALGDGSNLNGNASIQGGRLRLTQDLGAGGFSSFAVPALANSSLGWTVSFSLEVFDSVGNNDPADGFSFNYGNASLTELGNAEEGMTTAQASNNLSFEVDTWQNFDAEQGVNISQNVLGVETNLAFTNGPILRDGERKIGVFTGSWDPINGASFSTTGLETNAAFSNIASGLTGSDAYNFIISGRVGGANQDVFIDNLVITTVPEPTGVALLGLAGFGLMLRRRRR